MLVNSLSNLQMATRARALSSIPAVKNTDKTEDISFKGYYWGGGKQRELKPSTVKEINKAAEESGAPKEFVDTLVGASKGAFYNPTLEKDFIFSPANIVDIVKAYSPDKQAAFNYLSDQEGDTYDEERFSGNEMKNMYLALDKGSLKELKELVNARSYSGYHKYNGNQIAQMLSDK